MHNNKYVVEYSKEHKRNDLNGIFCDLGQIEKLKKSNYVIIKPNFAAGTYAEPNSHIITDLTLISSLIKFILWVDPQKTIYIAESDSTGYGFAFLKFENLGLPESLDISEEALKHVKCLDLSRDRLVKCENKKFMYFNNVDRQLWLSKTLIECDFIINATNLKTHSVTGFTGACKNLFGTLYQCDKWIFHTHISEVIHDLTVAIKPQINIVDAFFGMEYNGPVAGKKINAGFRIWSVDYLMADIIACQMIDKNVNTVKHLKNILKNNNLDVNDILEKVKFNENKIVRFHPPFLFLRFSNRMGLFIQSIGENIQHLGHRVHMATNIFFLVISIFRPLLLKAFGRDRLVKIKHILLGERNR